MRGDFPRPVKWGQWREGIGFRADELDAWILSGGLLWQGPVLGGRTRGEQQNEGDYSMADVEQAYKEAANKVGAAKEAYSKIVADFKGNIKNDLTSISASADRVLRENEKMRAAYAAAAGLLTSPEMEKAIANAERLAKALEAISALQSHSITFAVIDKKPPA